MKKNIQFFCLNLSAAVYLFLVFSGCASASSSPAENSGGAFPAGAPEWVRKPNAHYPDSLYVAATGSGIAAEEAEHKARANLLRVFEIRLTDESVIADVFRQTTADGNTSWSETVTSDRRISSSAAGILAGCEIKESWKNERGNEYYALAVMERAKTISIYNDIIARLQRDIEEVINVPNKNTIEGYTRYRAAAAIAKDIDTCVNILRFVGGSGSVPAGLRSENQYLADASNIIKAIPVSVSVKGDRNNRIQGAFSKALSDLGFQSGGTNSRYRVAAEVNLSEAPSAQNIFVRYEINANFIDTDGNRVLVPYNISGREGHTSLANAENRVFSAAEKTIAEGFSQALNDYFSRLLP